MAQKQYDERREVAWITPIPQNLQDNSIIDDPVIRYGNWSFTTRKDEYYKVINPNHREYESPQHKYWDQHWPKSDIFYFGRIAKTEKDLGGSSGLIGQTTGTVDFTKTQPIDVRKFVSDDDRLLKDVVRIYGLLESTNDRTIRKIQKWIFEGTYTKRYVYAGGSNWINGPLRKTLTYVEDKVNAEAQEYWQFPFETLANGYGDCEDGAILIASLAINAGIKPWRIKVAVGNIDDDPTGARKKADPNFEPTRGGHCWVLYCCEKDNEWRIVDWCFGVNAATIGREIQDEPLAKMGGVNGWYIPDSIKFTFNNEDSWASASLTSFYDIKDPYKGVPDRYKPQGW